MPDVSSSSAEVSAVCPDCGTLMPPESGFCPGCGRTMQRPPMQERVIAAVAYLTFLPAAVLLLLPQFRKSRFVRFHAWQSIFLWAAFFVVTAIGVLVSNIAAAIVLLLLSIVLPLGMFFLWLVLSVKAWQGEVFKLPFFGLLAERLR